MYRLMDTLMKVLRRLLRTARNAWFDFHYGGFVGGYLPNPHPGARGTGATDYTLMPQLFGELIRPDDVLVDVGCGFGRVINWWLSRGHRGKIYGLELFESVAEKTRKRLRRYPNVTIVAGDAIANLPANGNLYYLFNPFAFPQLFLQFMDRLYELQGPDRDYTVVYFACVHLDLLLGDRRWSVERLELKLPKVGFFEDRHRHFAIIRPVATSSTNN